MRWIILQEILDLQLDEFTFERSRNLCGIILSTLVFILQFMPASFLFA